VRRTSGERLRVVENVAIVALLVLLQAWCGLWMFAFLRAVHALPLADDALRAASAAAALAGVAFGIWTLYVAWRRFRHR